MVTQITFSLQDGFYTSQPISPDSDGCVKLHLNCNNFTTRIIIESSIDSSVSFATFKDFIVENCIYVETFKVSSGQTIRVRSQKEPVVALTSGII